MVKEKNKKDNIVQKHNDIVRYLRHRTTELTLNEQKLINYALSELTMEQLEKNDFPLQVFKIKDIAKVTGVRIDGYYTEIRELTLNLLSKPFEIQKPDFKGRLIVSQINWFEVCDYNLNEGSISIKFHKSLVPYVLRLKEKGNFTSYRLQNIITAKNKYYTKWYELFISWINIKNSLDRTIDDVRGDFQLENKYKRDYNLIVKVIKEPIAEINEKSDLMVELIEQKEKNKIIGYKFIFRYKTWEEYLKGGYFDDKQ